MAKLIVRFYGRFLCAVETANGAPTGTIKLAAPRFAGKFRPHKTMLSVATIHVDSAETDLQPTMMIAAPQSPEGGRAETILWDLENCEVTLGDAGALPATLGVSPHSPNFPLLDLDNLVQRVNGQPAQLKPGALSVGYETQAVVHVTQGRGIVHRVLRPDITKDIGLRKIGDEGFLVTVADTQDPDPNNDEHHGGLGEKGEVTELGIGEVVDFELELLPLMPFTFTITREGRPVGKISVRAVVDEQVITASFSTLCATLPTNEHYDLEFEQYYRALTPDTDPGELALVPKPTDDGGEPASCQCMVCMHVDASTGAAMI